MVRQLTTCVVSLYASGYRAEATQLADESFAMIDKILTERPWDWFIKGAARDLGWGAGASLAELGDQDKSQVYLQRAWYGEFKMVGRDDLIGKYPVLPIKGSVPASVASTDKIVFEHLDINLKSNSYMKRITAPVDIDGVSFPYHLYVVHGKQGYRELQDQVVWLREYLGAKINKKITDSFHRLNKIAIDNDVDFAELVIYAMEGTAPEEKK